MTHPSFLRLADLLRRDGPDHPQLLPQQPVLTLDQRVAVLTIAATTTDRDVKRHALAMLEPPPVVRLGDLPP